MRPGSECRLESWTNMDVSIVFSSSSFSSMFFNLNKVKEIHNMIWKVHKLLICLWTWVFLFLNRKLMNFTRKEISIYKQVSQCLIPLLNERTTHLCRIRPSPSLATSTPHTPPSSRVYVCVLYLHPPRSICIRNKGSNNCKLSRWSTN